MRDAHWRFFVCVCALMGLAVFSVLLTSPTSYARGQRIPMVDDDDNFVCPLSPKQEKESIAAFDAMMPVFTNPRCINCHGAVNPFAEDGKHLGGKIPLKMETATEYDYDQHKEVQVVRPVDDQSKQCEDCHSLLIGWQIPPEDLFFVGKDAPALCEQMIRKLKTSQNFIAHIENEQGGIQFIEEAFRGTRALNDANGQATYEDATGKDYQPEPMAISHAQFVTLGRAWIKAMGDKFQGGNTCGCKPHQYALKIGADIGLLFDQGAGTGSLKGKVDSHEDLKIPITFEDDGSLHGQTTADRAMSGGILVSTPLGSISCQLSYTVAKEVWKIEGKPAQNGKGGFEIELSNSWPNPAKSVAVCTGGGTAALAPPVSAAGSLRFQMSDILDRDPGVLDVGQLPSVQKYTVHWVDETP